MGSLNPIVAKEFASVRRLIFTIQKTREDYSDARSAYTEVQLTDSEITQIEDEQLVTDIEITQIEDEQMLTDHDIAIMELQAAAE